MKEFCARKFLAWIFLVIGANSVSAVAAENSPVRGRGEAAKEASEITADAVAALVADKQWPAARALVNLRLALRPSLPPAERLRHLLLSAALAGQMNLPLEAQAELERAESLFAVMPRAENPKRWTQLRSEIEMTRWDLARIGAP